MTVRRPAIKRSDERLLARLNAAIGTPYSNERELTLSCVWFKKWRISSPGLSPAGVDFSSGEPRSFWPVGVGVYGGGGDDGRFVLTVLVDGVYDGGHFKPGGKILSTLDI